MFKSRSRSNPVSLLRFTNVFQISIPFHGLLAYRSVGWERERWNLHSAHAWTPPLCSPPSLLHLPRTNGSRLHDSWTQFPPFLLFPALWPSGPETWDKSKLTLAYSSLPCSTLIVRLQFDITFQHSSQIPDHPKPNPSRDPSSRCFALPFILYFILYHTVHFLSGLPHLPVPVPRRNTHLPLHQSKSKVDFPPARYRPYLGPWSTDKTFRIWASYLALSFQSQVSLEKIQRRELILAWYSKSKQGRAGYSARKDQDQDQDPSSIRVQPQEMRISTQQWVHEFCAD